MFLAGHKLININKSPTTIANNIVPGTDPSQITEDRKQRVAAQQY